jgi:hypothetical protein
MAGRLPPRSAKQGSSGFRVSGLLPLAAAFFAFALVDANAQTPGEKLQELRDDGLYEAAVEYLDQVRGDLSVSEEFREKIDYEAAVTLIAASKDARDPSKRHQLLGRAQSRLASFLEAHPEHELSAKATTDRMNVLVELGQISVRVGRRLPEGNSDRQRCFAGARAFFRNALAVAEKVEKRAYERAKHYEERSLDASSGIGETEARDQARRDLLQARLYAIAVIHELGKSYEPGTPEFKEHVTEAAKKYHEYSEKYARYTAGAWARLCQGKCRKDLGSHDEAIAIADEIRQLPGPSDPFGTFRTEAVLLAMDCLLAPGVQKSKEALNWASQWLESTRRQAVPTPPGRPSASGEARRLWTWPASILREAIRARDSRNWLICSGSTKRRAAWRASTSPTYRATKPSVR